MTKDKDKTPHGRWPWWGLLGLAILSTGLWFLIEDVEFWTLVWYVPAWYGYLLMLDAALHRLTGSSFLSRRRRELAAMLFWSVPFWFLYEAYNMVLKNWYYVFLPREELFIVVFSFLAYATVLPACFFHAELLKALGFARGLRWRRLPDTRRTRLVWLVMGILCIVTPIFWPRWAFPLVWGATFWIPDLVNRSVGAPSLLGDLTTGRGGRLTRLLVGGMWAGLVWELFNYYSRCKWIYTVPGLEDWKLFEMPVLGFFGFPALAIAAYGYYVSVCHFLRGGRSWEEDRTPRVSPPGSPRGDRPASRLLYGVAVAFAVIFSLTLYVLTLGDTEAHPRRPLLADLDGIGSAARLRAAGLPTPEKLDEAVRSAGVPALAERLGIAPDVLEEASRHAALSIHKGMGTESARLLLAAGVAEVADLPAQDADSLARRLRELAAENGVPAPRAAMVKVWIRAVPRNGAPRR